MPAEGRCFVIMPFSPELREVFDHGIKPAVTACGYQCLRADETAFNGSINQLIVQEIIESDIIIADLTGNNPNVFYELGIAHAIGDKTIMITQQVDRLPFDIASYRVVTYRQTISGAVALRDELAKAIQNFPQWKQRPTNPVQDFRTRVRPATPESVLEARIEHLEQRIADIEKRPTRAADASEPAESRPSRPYESDIVNSGGALPIALVQSVASSNTALFVGAGISLAAGYPSARELVAALQQELGTPPTNASFPDAMAQAINEHGRARVVQFLMERLARQAPAESKIHATIAQLPFDVVVTTNFDTLLEQAFQRTGKHCFTVVSPEELAYSRSGVVSVLKLHGSIERPDSLLLTPRDYRAFETSRELLANAFQNYLVTRSPIFVGSSLSDETILRILEETGRKLGAHAPRAYVVVPQVDPAMRARLEGLWPVTFILEKAETFFASLERDLKAAKKLSRE